MLKALERNTVVKFPNKIQVVLYLVHHTSFRSMTTRYQLIKVYIYTGLLQCAVREWSTVPDGEKNAIFSKVWTIKHLSSIITMSIFLQQIKSNSMQVGKEQNSTPPNIQDTVCLFNSGAQAFQPGSSFQT